MDPLTQITDEHCDWRQYIQKGDQLQAYDGRGWFAATVYGVDQKDGKDDVFICYDNFSSKYDFWCPRVDKCLRPTIGFLRRKIMAPQAKQIMMFKAEVERLEEERDGLHQKLVDNQEFIEQLQRNNESLHSKLAEMRAKYQAAMDSLNDNAASRELHDVEYQLSLHQKEQRDAAIKAVNAHYAAKKSGAREATHLQLSSPSTLASIDEHPTQEIDIDLEQTDEQTPAIGSLHRMRNKQVVDIKQEHDDEKTHDSDDHDVLMSPTAMSNEQQPDERGDHSEHGDEDSMQKEEALKMERLQRELQAATKLNQEKDAMLAEYREKYERLQEEVEELKREMSEFRERASEAEREKSEIQQELARVNRKILNVQQEKEWYKAEMEKLSKVNKKNGVHVNGYAVAALRGQEERTAAVEHDVEIKKKAVKKKGVDYTIGVDMEEEEEEEEEETPHKKRQRKPGKESAEEAEAESGHDAKEIASEVETLSTATTDGYYEDETDNAEDAEDSDDMIEID